MDPCTVIILHGCDTSDVCYNDRLHFERGGGEGREHR